MSIGLFVDFLVKLYLNSCCIIALEMPLCNISSLFVFLLKSITHFFSVQKGLFIVFSPKFHFNWMFSKQCSFSSPSFVCTQRIVQMFIRLTQTNAFDANAPETFHLFSATSEMKYNETPERKNQFPKNAFWKYSKNFWLKDIELRRSCGHGQVGCLVRPYSAVSLASRRCQVFTAKSWPTKVTSGSIARTSPIFELLGLLVRLKLSLSHYWGIKMSHCQASSSEKALFKPRSIYR